MRPHVYRITAVLLIFAITGCAREASPAPGVVASSAAATEAVTPSPAPSVALQPPHTFVFSATGTAAVISVTYELDGHETTKKSIKLPWREVTDVPADGRLHSWSLSAESRGGKIKLVGLMDGAVSGQSIRQGSGTGTVSVSGEFRG